MAWCILRAHYQAGICSAKALIASSFVAQKVTAHEINVGKKEVVRAEKNELK